MRRNGWSRSSECAQKALSRVKSPKQGNDGNPGGLDMEGRNRSELSDPLELGIASPREKERSR
jgi:hypothetical protein